MKYSTGPFVILMLPVAFLALAFTVAYGFLDEKLFESFTNDKKKESE